LRRAGTRPSLLDVVLLGTWAAAGFSVYENASYGRGAFSLEAEPIISVIFPMMIKGSAYGWTLVQSGHVVHTALIALGVGFSLLYRNRLPQAWIPKAWVVGAIAIAAALIEHCSQNSIITGGINKIVGEALLLITLNGRLCALLLAAGVGYVLAMEWRAVGTPFRPREWLQLQPDEIKRRGILLAALQARPQSSP
jgi:RsiW-degrading membrane proteinase PrsW (M82 family)